MVGDVRHALGQTVDQVEVFAGLFRVAALKKDFGARHEGSDRGERLVHFMRDSGRHLPERGKLAGLHQFVLRRAQPCLGAPTLVNLGL